MPNKTPSGLNELGSLTSLGEYIYHQEAKHPHYWKLPHDEFRLHQLDSIIWVLANEGFSLLEAPTGSGKTGIAKACASVGGAIAVCRTKNLQRVNYGQMYKAAILYGKGNYPCKHPENRNLTGAECLYVGKSMDADCKYSNRCPYLIAKWRARDAEFCCLNYAYFLLTSWHLKHPPACLFLDEAHQVPDMVLEFVGCTIFESDLINWGLTDPPDTNSMRNGGMLFKFESPVGVVIQWLGTVLDATNGVAGKLRDLDTKVGRKEAVKTELFEQKVSRTRDALQTHPDDWFIMSGRFAKRMGKGKRRVPVLVCRPLTARHHLPLGFQVAGRTILMSATIGDPKVLAEELGIEEFKSRAVPNQWEPFQRPVQVLDAPKLNYKSDEKAFEKQADVIAGAIKGCPKGWPGLIHVTRKRESKLLAERLAHRGLQDRVWVMPGADGVYVPTDRQVEAWTVRKRYVPNSICISWSLVEGFDGLQERININAKVGFPALGDPYERARMHYSNKFYLQRTAYTLEQSLGRTRRGREQDYDTQGERRGLVAIADGNYMRVRKYLSESLREALVED